LNTVKKVDCAERKKEKYPGIGPRSKSGRMENRVGYVETLWREENNDGCRSAMLKSKSSP